MNLDRRAVGVAIAAVALVVTYDVNGYGDRSSWWAAIAAVVLGALMADTFAMLDDRRPAPGLVPSLLLGVLVAIGACVPETDQLVLVALAPTSLIAAEIIARRRVADEWYALVAGLIGWGGLYGATGRTSALAGALFAWWAFVLIAFVCRRWPTIPGATSIAAGGIGVVASIAMARTGGVSTSDAATIASVVICAVVSVAAVVGLVVLSARRSRPTD